MHNKWMSEWMNEWMNEWTSIENHNIDTRQRNNLYLPQANLTIYQKGAYYLG